MPSASHTEAASCSALDVLKLPLVATVSPTVNSQQLEILLILRLDLEKHRIVVAE